MPFDAVSLARRVWAPFRKLFAEDGSLFWLHIVSATATAIAFSVYWIVRFGKTRLSPRGFLAFLLPGSIYRHRSAKLDFKYFLVNTIVFGGFVAPFLLTSTTVARFTVAELVALFGVPAHPVAASLVVNIALTIVIAIATDLGFFVSHWLQHRVSVLWEFHKVHHSAEVLHPLTAFRSHPVDRALDALLSGLTGGAALGLTAYVFDASLDVVTLFGTNAVAFLFLLAGAHLRHSHVRVSYGRTLSRILVSPELHQFHHSRKGTVARNLGGTFAVWDWLAATLYVPRAEEELEVGLDGEEDDYTSLGALYTAPFVKLARRLRKR